MYLLINDSEDQLCLTDKKISVCGIFGDADVNNQTDISGQNVPM
jgi:hypothetical protein